MNENNNASASPQNPYPANQPYPYLNEPPFMLSSIEDEEPDRSSTTKGILVGTLGYMIILPLLAMLVVSFFVDLNVDHILITKDGSADVMLNAQLIGGVIAIILSFYVMSRQSAKNIIKGFNVKNLGIACLGVLAMFGANIIGAMITTTLFGEVSQSSNQNELESLASMSPILLVLLVSIVAPIIEELTYRYFIFKGLLKVNRFLAFFVSVLAFVLIHFIASIGSPDAINELKGFLGYAAPAIVLTLFYYKNKNLATNIMIHSIYNTIIVIVMLTLV